MHEGLATATTESGKTAPPAGLPFTRADIEQTVPERFAQVARCFPDHVALTGKGRQWTYRALDGRANWIAHAIKERAQRGSGCVAYLVDHSPEMVIATLAVLKAGKTYLAIYPAMPGAKQADIVRDVAPELILTTAAQESRARELAAGMCPVLRLDENDAGSVADGPDLETLPHHPSTLFYTSGTTGQPKGVVKSHRAVLHRVWLAVQHDKITAADRLSLLTHCSFSASEADMFGALLNGATLCTFDVASEGLTAVREWLEAEADHAAASAGAPVPAIPLHAGGAEPVSLGAAGRAGRRRGAAGRCRRLETAFRKRLRADASVLHQRNGPSVSRPDRARCGARVRPAAGRPAGRGQVPRARRRSRPAGCRRRDG